MNELVDMAGNNWTDLSALAALIGVLVWGITKGLPNLIESFRQETQQQRQDFRDELKEHREQSRQLAESGHKAVNNLADAFSELKHEMQLDRQRRSEA